MGRKRFTYDFVKKQFEKESYRLVSEEYINSKTKLDYICPKGHRSSIRYNDFNRGQRCRKCKKYNYKCHGSHKSSLSIDDIRSYFYTKGYKLLSKDYINSQSKLEYECPNGHRHAISYIDFRSGRRCYYCGRIKTENARRMNISFIKEEFEKEEYKLLTMIYKNNRQKLRYICPRNHKYFITWDCWQRGHRCKKCAEEDYVIKYSGENSPHWRGGLSLLGYCPIWKDKEFKRDILVRDDYKCQNYFCWNKKGNAGKLVIHHIDYNRKNCHPSNLITLCMSCNGRANKDRKRHKNFYSKIIKKKYNYKEV